jgi:predicted acyltransferase
MPPAKSPDVLDPPARLGSLDAYRGLVMIALAAQGFGIAATAANFPENALWQKIGYQFEHVEWVGCAFWDLIQPSFMFMVGVALPFSFAGRVAQGYSGWQMWVQAAIRAAVLIWLGIFLRSQSGPLPNFTFMDVITQIGLGYLALFALWNRPAWLQLLVAQVILGAYWAWFAFTPVSQVDLESVGVMPEWQQLHALTGFEAHWQKNANPAAAFDRWFLNLLPRKESFVFDGGGYATLNFIPSLVTMIFGLMTGEAIRNSNSKGNIVGGLILCAILGLASGWALDYFHVCPLVKRIWTPSWTLFSTGWCWLILAAFYLVIDVLRIDRWAFPLKVAGMNSIALYVMGKLIPGWTAENLDRWLGPITKAAFGNELFDLFGTEYAPLVRCNLVLLCFWLFVYWMYRQKLFVRI